MHFRRVGEGQNYLRPVPEPHRAHGREFRAPCACKRIKRHVGQLGGGGIVDRFERRCQLFTVYPSCQCRRAADQVHDARLELRLRINCLNRLRQAAQAISDGDPYSSCSPSYTFTMNIEPSRYIDPPSAQTENPRNLNVFTILRNIVENIDLSAYDLGELKSLIHNIDLETKIANNWTSKKPSSKYLPRLKSQGVSGRTASPTR